MSIYTKLHTIQKAIRGLGKDKSGGQYTYVSGNKILPLVRTLMDEHGILLKQEVIGIENSRQDYTVGRENKPKSEILSKVSMRFTWIDIETGEKDENLFAANGQNDWEKGLGSALTYGERYFLLKFFHIPTDEDDIDNPDRKPAEDTRKELPAEMASSDKLLSWIDGKVKVKTDDNIRYLITTTYKVSEELLKQIISNFREYEKRQSDTSQPSAAQ